VRVLGGSTLRFLICRRAGSGSRTYAVALDYAKRIESTLDLDTRTGYLLNSITIKRTLGIFGFVLGEKNQLSLHLVSLSAREGGYLTS
jgi:hypothetical protein